MPMSTPRQHHPDSAISPASDPAGSRVAAVRANSTPTNSPAPHLADQRMAPLEVALGGEQMEADDPGRTPQPLLLDDFQRRRRLQREAAVEPPRKVLKNSMPLANDAAIAGVVTTLSISDSRWRSACQRAPGMSGVTP
ncbi:MAG: hypothetical protein IPI73_25995 [Betaproteobacteria bacterium]|nr:hypothetical protein [Betaproteobacteria bacterium]